SERTAVGKLESIAAGTAVASIQINALGRLGHSARLGDMRNGQCRNSRSANSRSTPGIVLEQISISSAARMAFEEYRTFSSCSLDDVSLEQDCELLLYYPVSNIKWRHLSPWPPFQQRSSNTKWLRLPGTYATGPG